MDTPHPLPWFSPRSNTQSTLSSTRSLELLFPCLANYPPSDDEEMVPLKLVAKEPVDYDLE